MIAPIETRFGGRLYRSRTEARWAVALSVARIAFEYEHEGFDLPCGRYLPDFWLPERQIWIEIKGVAPGAVEHAKCDHLAKATGHSVLMFVGSPSPENCAANYYIGDTIGTSDEGSCLYDNHFWLPAEAYDSALAERFDGRAITPRARSAATTRRSSRFW